jgi:glucose/mannose-6-phosphate isomerase
VNLDDLEAISKLDSHNIIAEIDMLPDQLQSAWDLGCSLGLPPWKDLQRVVLAGMGVSALAADLFVSYISSSCLLPVFVVRDYALPAWATDPETLVILVSYACDTEEALSVYQHAVERGCRILTIAGDICKVARTPNECHAIWQFDYASQIGSAVGMCFGLLLAAFTRLDLIADPGEDLFSAISIMKTQQATLGANVPLTQNGAKRLAGQCMGRWLMIFGSDHLAPVARYWKTQLNKLAKTGAQWEEIPEANHNTLLGVMNPSEQISKTMLLFLRARDCHPRNQQRTEITKEFFMLEGLGTDFFNAKGDTILAQMWMALHFGDYLAYYLAIQYGVDPGLVDAVAGLKEYLKTV